LTRHKPKPGGKIPAPSECPSVANCSYQRRHVQRANIRNSQEALRSLIRAGSLGKPCIEICDPVIKGNSAQTHIADEPVDTGAQHWLVTIEHLTQPDGKLCAPLRNDVTALQE
jgi:hypothetical protein